MSPTQTNDKSNGLCPPPLKINKDSHIIIKKSPSVSPSSSSSSCLGAGAPTKPLQQPHPVIIYTHSPKVIHTHPKDFMALVQKLTGLSQERACSSQENGNGSAEKNVKNSGNDDNESTSVMSDENYASVVDGQVNSWIMPTINFEPPNPFINDLPLFPPNSADLLCANQSFFNYTDNSLFINPPTIGSLEGFSELRDY